MFITSRGSIMSLSRFSSRWERGERGDMGVGVGVKAREIDAVGMDVVER